MKTTFANVTLAMGIVALGAGIAAKGHPALPASFEAPRVLPAGMLTDSITASYTLLEVLAADCVWCRVSSLAWNRIRDSLRTRDPRIKAIAVSFSDLLDTRQFVRERELIVDKIMPFSRDSLLTWGFDRTPITVLVDSTGAVRFAAAGEVDDSIQTDVLRTYDRLSTAGH